MIDATTLALIKKMGGSTGGGGGGDSGADLLNADGVIKQEVLPDGYPYSGMGIILPETTVEITSPEMGLPDIIDITVGAKYIVNWNGVDYECTAGEVDIDMLVPALGNIGAIMGGDDTGEPFLILAIPAEQAQQMGVGLMFMPLEEITSVTFSISGETITKIDEKYIPDGANGKLTVYATAMLNDSGVTEIEAIDKPFFVVSEAIEADKTVVAVVSVFDISDRTTMLAKFYMPVTSYVPGSSIWFNCCSNGSTQITSHSLTYKADGSWSFIEAEISNS